MKIVGRMTIDGIDVEFDIDMTKNPPYKMAGKMIVNGIEMDIDALNTPLMSGNIKVEGKKIPLGLSRLLNPA